VSKERQQRKEYPGIRSNDTNLRPKKTPEAHPKKKLDEIEEVYEELNGFIAHTKLAFKSFAYLTYHILKIIFSFTFSKVLFPLLEKVIILILFLVVGAFVAIAFVSSGLAKLCKNGKSPFANKKNFERLSMLDMIKERKKMTLVLDLDGTLVYVARVKRERIKRGIKCETVNLQVLGEKEQTLYLYVRPYLEEFLTRLSEYFNIVVFSAGEEEYINKVVDYLDKWQIIQQRFSRNFCDLSVDKKISKDLKRICPNGISQVIMIEDAPTICEQKEHTISVSRWEGKDPKDTDLKYLCEFLLENVENAQNARQLVDLYEVKLKLNQTQEAATGSKGTDEREKPQTQRTSVQGDDTITIKQDNESTHFKMDKDPDNHQQNIRFDTDQDTIKDDTDTESRLGDMETILNRLPPSIQVLSPKDE
jgi:Dullard-like phosphatase family protein